MYLDPSYKQIEALREKLLELKKQEDNIREKRIVATIVKKIDRRIAKLKKILDEQKRDSGCYSNEFVSNTKAVIKELIRLKNSLK